MYQKIIIMLMVSIIAAALFAQSEIGEGMLGFGVKAKAEQAVGETRDVLDAVDAYSAVNGGLVDFGDVDEGEDFLMYIKNKKLLVQRAGTENAIIKEWALHEETGMIRAMVENEKLCRNINAIVLSQPVETPIPLCDDVMDERRICCIENSES